MKPSHSFFENRACKYFPCHKGLEDFNCLFCFCPMYHMQNCLGSPEYMEVKGKKLKVCTNCTFPHQPKHYEAIMNKLKNEI
ncbi:MAG: cysteine-rich small domain-containing protein [Lachnospiraceae bacterium]|nr:metal-binding protein [Lachnospiraceae bacterium]MEE1342372.1 cysteine-rich small domain-containing protein [Lachnospiraceae bacterium]